MEHVSRAVPLALLLVLLGGCPNACGPSVVGEGEACGDTAVCSNGLTCLAGVCTATTGDAGAVERDAGTAAEDAGNTGTDGAVLLDSGPASDGGGGSVDGSMGLDASVTGDAGGSVALVCQGQGWRPAVPARGAGVMAFGAKAYLFAVDGLFWTVVENGVGTVQPIPLPAGVTAMSNAVVELMPSGRPLVMFRDGPRGMAAVFDGVGFVRVLELGNFSQAHGDASETVFAMVDNVITEFTAQGPLVRGGLPQAMHPRGWTVSAGGTVHAFYEDVTTSPMRNELRVARLARGTTVWTPGVLVGANAGYGFVDVKLAAGADGSVHAAYTLTDLYVFSSPDGITWTEEMGTTFRTQARMVDPAPLGSDPSQVARVAGDVAALVAVDLGHVQVLVAYTSGSFGTPSQYLMRRCPGAMFAWSAERFAFGGQLFDTSFMAVTPDGFAAVKTPRGVRQNAPPSAPPVEENFVTAPVGAPPTAVPLCSAAVPTQGAMPTAFNPNAYGTVDQGPLVTMDARALVFLAGTSMWTTLADMDARTSVLPMPASGGTNWRGYPSLSGRVAVAYWTESQSNATVFDGTSFSAPVETPCGGDLACQLRATVDGRIWALVGSTFHQQSATGWDNHGAAPGMVLNWDVDTGGNLRVITSAFTPDVLRLWTLAPGGWQQTGALTQAAVAAVDALIEGGYRPGITALAQDGSVHVLSDARCIGTGERNKVQAYARTQDGTTWEVTTLPDVDTLHGGQLTWSHATLWARDFDQVRYAVTSSVAPTFDGTWRYPDRRMDLVARCLDAQGQPTFARMAGVRVPGWNTKAFAQVSPWGVGFVLTEQGLTRVAF